MGYPHRSLLLLVAMILLSQTGLTQYYFYDLVSLKRSEETLDLYRSLHVRKVEQTGILPGGGKQPDYQEESTLSADGDTLWHQRSIQGVVSYQSTLFDHKGKTLEQSEVRPGIKSLIQYTYDLEGRVMRMENQQTDSLMDAEEREIHLWNYNEKGQPKQMWRLVISADGMVDSTEVRFTIDSIGQVTEENIFKRGVETGFYYYYYNARGQITDIVRYNPKWKRLLPDQLFEYDEEGFLTQRMQLTGVRDITYLIWRYGYGTNGLLSEEALFNNKKEYTGSIRYTYSYAP